MGANLRTTRLDAAGIRLTIRCGRPGTGMPSFDAGAYSVRACYGRPLGAAPDNLQPTPRTLSADEIDALITYLQERIVGRGRKAYRLKASNAAPSSTSIDFRLKSIVRNGSRP